MEGICSTSQLNMMKMTTIAAIAGLLLCCFASSDTCDVYGATGGSVTLKLEHTLRESQVLKWTHDNVVIFERMPDMLVTGNKNDIHANGSLWLRNLTVRKEGKYKPEIFEEGLRKGNLKAISLCVMDPVPKPQANHTCKGNMVYFNCFVSKLPSSPKYKWLQNGNVMPKEISTFKLRNDDLVGEQKFTCIVYNNVSSESAEPVTYTCGKENGIFPEELFGINTWIIVGVGGGVVLLLIVLVLVCCIRNRRRRRMQIKDEVELRLGWATSEQQHADQHRCRPPGQQQHPNHHHPHHHHHQQPAGHTGPRQHRSKGQPRPTAPEVPGSHPQPSPRRATPGPRPVPDNEEQPPPLPQPRKKALRGTKA